MSTQVDPKKAEELRQRIARQVRFWGVSLVVFLVLLYLLRSVLLPFVAGMAIAYLLDPICDRMEKWGLSRTWATTLVTLVFVLVLVFALLLIIPTLAAQASEFVANLPRFAESLQNQLEALAGILQSTFDPELLQRIRDAVGSSFGDVSRWLLRFLGEVLSGGVAFANLLSLLFITPIVTFYLLRDWDRIVTTVDSWLPRDHAETIRDLAKEVDTSLAGFVRGQGMVCGILGVFYAVSLSLAGLNFGLLIGLTAGLLSFIPFVGSVIGLLLSVGLALIQFDSWVNVAIVAAIFLVGQALEGNVLTPKLVGERIGLHAVWVIFGLLAGGALFGFVGVLLAVPVAAIVGVGVRFGLGRYLASMLYIGHSRDKQVTSAKDKAQE